MADTRAIASAVTLYADHMGRLPESFESLTRIAVNERGESAGPFLASVPTAPAGSPAYRYEVGADHTFHVVGEAHGRTFDAGSRS